MAAVAANHTIRFRLTLRLLIVIFTVIFIGEAGIYLTVRATVYHQYDEALRTRLLNLVALIEYEDQKLQLEFDEDDEEPIPHESMPQYVAIWLENGALFYANPANQEQRLDHLVPGSIQNPAYHTVTVGLTKTIRAAAARFQVMRGDGVPPEARTDIITDKRSTMPVIDLAVADNRAPLDSMLQRLLVYLVFGTLLMAALLALLATGIINRELHPLQKVSRGLATLNIDRLDKRFESEALPAELVPIIERLNDFLARLEASVERERRFTSNAAHELRTPLAELRAVLEVAARWPEKADPGTTLTECLRISERMEKLVSTLLEIARCQATKRLIEKDTYYLEDIVTGCMEPFTGLAKSHGLKIEMAHSGSQTLTTDGDLLSGILSNLFQNAVHYAHRNSIIKIDSQIDQDVFTIAVTNDQNGIEAADTSHLFTPFWRKDQARTNRNNLGLGLTLSAAYASLLMCRLTASLSPDGAITFTISNNETQTPSPPDVRTKSPLS